MLQFGLSLAAWAAVGFGFVRPWLAGKPLRDALSILLLPQLFRHVGVTLLVPGVVDPTLPAAFARQTAIGDTVAVALAWVAFLALRLEWRGAIALAWVFNVVALADMLLNLLHAARVGAAEHLGAAWYGPSFIVPAMLVVHALLFVFLVRAGWSGRAEPS